MITSDQKEALGVALSGAWVTFLISLFVVGFSKTSLVNCCALVAPASYVGARVIQLISEAAPILLGVAVKLVLMTLGIALWIYAGVHSSTLFWEWL